MSIVMMWWWWLHMEITCTAVLLHHKFIFSTLKTIIYLHEETLNALYAPLEILISEFPKWQEQTHKVTLWVGGREGGRKEGSALSQKWCMLGNQDPEWKFSLLNNTNNKESSQVKKILVLASTLANSWLFSSSFLICLTQNISKQFRVTDTNIKGKT